jgi:hypothetical protein
MIKIAFKSLDDHFLKNNNNIFWYLEQPKHCRAQVACFDPIYRQLFKKSTGSIGGQGLTFFLSPILAALVK